MAQVENAVTLDDVLQLAWELSAVDKIRLIQRIAPEIERELNPASTGASRSLLGILKDLGSAPSAEEIDKITREGWSGIESEDL